MNTVPCIVLKISYVFNKQDEHNASFFKMSCIGLRISNGKVNHNIWDFRALLAKNY